MSDIRTCPDCGATEHVSKMWPECSTCENMDDQYYRAPREPDIFDYKAFPVPLEYAQRAARVWCMSETKDYEMQSGICYLVARLIYHLERAETELFDINSNRGSRLEIGASIRPILNALL